eukprot:TRINITY_DN7333_c0_g1_i1.p1 TRINITY_DN7333_c0_g1~~TRINITY_DN7333_c0_g1_i1.p1  ORF type:complete len:117 (-),score=22.79 TRINITY_DN7333_c0_g1_i1:391-741(-)
MDIITSTIIVAQNQEGKMVAHGLHPNQEQKDKHVECVGRGLLQALGIGSITFTTSYFSQKYFTRNIKGMKTSNVIISSTVFTGFAAYLTGKAALEMCNKNFERDVKKAKRLEALNH